MVLQFLQVCHIWRTLLPLMRMFSHSSGRIAAGLLYCGEGRSSFLSKTLALINLSVYFTFSLLSFLGSQIWIQLRFDLLSIHNSNYDFFSGCLKSLFWRNYFLPPIYSFILDLRVNHWLSCAELSWADSTSGNRATLEIWLSHKVAVILNRLLPWTFFVLMAVLKSNLILATLSPVLRIQLTSFFIVRLQLNFEDQLFNRQVRSSESSSPRWDVI